MNSLEREFERKEAKLRRRAERLGYRLRKERKLLYYPQMRCFMVTDISGSKCMHGPGLTLAAVAEFLEWESKQQVPHGEKIVSDVRPSHPGRWGSSNSD